MTASGLRAVSRSVVTVRDDVPPEVSDAYVAAHPLSSVYHRHAWSDVIRAGFGHETKYLVAEAADGVVGVLPLVFFQSHLFGRFVVSMPFLNYGGVLADGPEIARALLTRAIEETRGAGGSHLELRHTRQQFSDLAPKRHKVAMGLQLEASVDRQWNALDRKVRNQIRKAEKSALQGISGGIELLPDFYAVFARNMRDLGTPVYSPRFFRAVLETFPESSQVFLLKADDRPVAASLVHWHGDNFEIPWASSLREFKPLCANVLLYWHMVRGAVDRGFRNLDFGRSSPGDGAYQFKKQWGAEPRELVWEYWTAPGHAVPELNPANSKFALAIRAWQHLPLSVANALGPVVVRNLP